MASTKNALDSEKYFVETFNTNSSYRALVNEALGTNYRSVAKAEHAPVSVWWKGKTAKTKREVPKSDYVFDDAVGASWKSGPGRATSSNYSETKAIFEAVFELHPYFKEDEKLVEMVKNLFKTWESVKTPFDIPYPDPSYSKIYTFENILANPSICPEYAPKVKFYNDTFIELSELIRDIKRYRRDYLRKVIRECFLGEKKFEGLPQSPKHFIQCISGDIRKFKFAGSTNSEEFDQFVEEYLDKKISLKPPEPGKEPTKIVASKTSSKTRVVDGVKTPYARRIWDRFL